MATISQDDLNNIVDDIEMELSDADLLTATGITMTQLVNRIAPKQLDYINSFLFALYEPQGSPLESQTKTILTWLCIAEVLYFAYRTVEYDEKEWADEWRDRAVEWLKGISSGKMGLSSPTRQTNYTPKFDAEPRYFTLRDSDDFSREGILDLNDLFGD